VEIKIFLSWQQCAHFTKKNASYQAEYAGRNSLQRYSGIKIIASVGNKKEKEETKGSLETLKFKYVMSSSLINGT